jgi:hypothetical protein
MLENLINASIIFIFLVVLGFLVSDIFRMGRYFGIPSISKTDTERVLDYASTAIFFLMLFFIILVMILDPQRQNFISNSITPFFTVILNFLDQNFISQNIVLSYIGLLFWFSVIFLFVYIVVFSTGFLIRFIDENYIEVTFSDDSKTKFRSILSETDEFIFFEGLTTWFRWEAIRKEKIQSMKSVRGKSYADKYFADLWVEFIVFKNRILKK